MLSKIYHCDICEDPEELRYRLSYAKNLLKKAQDLNAPKIIVSRMEDVVHRYEFRLLIVHQENERNLNRLYR